MKKAYSASIGRDATMVGVSDEHALAEVERSGFSRLAVVQGVLALLLAWDDRAENKAARTSGSIAAVGTPGCGTKAASTRSSGRGNSPPDTAAHRARPSVSSGRREPRGLPVEVTHPDILRPQYTPERRQRFGAVSHQPWNSLSGPIGFQSPEISTAVGNFLGFLPL